MTAGARTVCATGDLCALAAPAARCAGGGAQRKRAKIAEIHHENEV